MNHQAIYKPLTVFAVTLLTVCAVGVVLFADENQSDAAGSGTSSNPWSGTVTANFSSFSEGGTYYIEVGTTVNFTSDSGADAFGITSVTSGYGLTGNSSGNLTGTVSRAGTITVNCEGVYGGDYLEWYITLIAIDTSTPVTSISISGSTSGEVGSSITLTATTSPSSADDRHVTWSITSGSTRASITSTTDTTTGGRAVISLESAGSVTVRATATDGSGVYDTHSITISNASTSLPDGVSSGSGTSNDPYIISMVGSQNYNITISPVGTFTTYRAIGSDITIPGISFTTSSHGTFTTLTTTQTNAGQLSSLEINGTPGLNGQWDFFAYNPSNEVYYRIVVTGVLNQFTLSFDANNGNGAPSSMNGTSTSSTYTFTIPSTIPTRSGYTFEGWNTNSSGTGTTYQPGELITIDGGTTTLYAMWSQITYTSTLNYSASGATNVPSTQRYTGTSTADHTFTISSQVPVRSGMVFLGWSTSSGATTATYQPGETISVGYNSTRTLYAVWETATLDITTSQGNTSLTVGERFSYAVGTNVSGCTVSVSGASWLSVSGNTVSGTPTSTGTYNVTVTISKDGGYTSDQQSFTITVYSSMGFTSEPGADGIYAFVE